MIKKYKGRLKGTFPGYYNFTWICVCEFTEPDTDQLKSTYPDSMKLEIGVSVSVTLSMVSKSICFFISDISELEKYLPLNKNNLFTATWSLSETSLEFRKKIMSLSFLKAFNNFFIAYQHKFNEVDNKSFFAKWINSRPDIKWIDQEIAHLRGNSYLVGKGKS